MSKIVQRFSLVLLICVICGLLPAFAQTLAQVPQAPPGTPLLPSWPYTASSMNSFTATVFYAGDFVCLDTVNSTGTAFYVVDNGTNRCSTSQPQAGLVWFSDATASTAHSVMIDPDIPRVAANCPLGNCPAPAVLLPPCNAVQKTACFK